MESRSPSHLSPSRKLIHPANFGKIAIYSFVGKLRAHTGTMAKVRAGDDSVVYGDSAFVPEQLEPVFRRLADENHLIGLPLSEFAARAGHFYGELDAVHPFREGNSRILRLFFHGMYRTAGFLLDWRIIAAAPDGRDRLDAARDRTVMHGDSAPLAALFLSILSPI